jgi:hypothetical protein
LWFKPIKYHLAIYNLPPPFGDAKFWLIGLYSDLFFEILPAGGGALEKTVQTASECQKQSGFVK